ncbi:MAG: hypothetical protein WCK58_13175 [Chloroflexota bacterium]
MDPVFTPTPSVAVAGDLLPPGTLGVSGDRRTTAANARAHAVLDILPGGLVGRSLVEACPARHAATPV